MSKFMMTIVRGSIIVFQLFSNTLKDQYRGMATFLSLFLIIPVDLLMIWGFNESQANAVRRFPKDAREVDEHVAGVVGGVLLKLHAATWVLRLLSILFG